jgi:WD40 repeat protein
MTTERKDEEAIFKAAFKLKSRTEQIAYLKKACGNDTDLLVRVEELLKAHEEAGDFLEAPVLDPMVTLNNIPLTEGPGTVIGRYKLLEQIGEGGFGVVYMADQTKPISRRVALKIIKLGMDTKEVIARFEAERQALAMMEHPNIAKVLDAGATDTGRPYFVMELVKGIPITEYCDNNNLDTQQRLELFINVCKAIQHAHQKGIIHRDLKPSNVMITLHDGKPVPKVIDFGIAKATGQRLTEKTLFTRFAQMIGTPEYMSPEQAEFSGLDVDTRSDIYSLGVLLYQLLTGVTPFDGEKLREAGYVEMQRIIREDDPDKPSTKLSTMGEALTNVAKHRRVAPEALRKLIRGDLDWIVMKTLEKDRTRRYETASELATDIERHLTDELVLAGPPSAGYRLRKFVRRNRVGVITGLLIAAALLAVAVVSAMYAREATLHARDVAIHANKAEDARQKAVKAQQETAGLLAGSYVDRAQALCEQGEVGRGMLWLADSLKVAPEDSSDLDHAVRTSLAAWHGQLHSLRAVFEYAPIQYPSFAVVFTEGPAGTYTMTSSGADIWNAADHFHFAYRILTGPGSIMVRVDSIDNTHDWAKAGVMIRETLDAGSKHVLACVTPASGIAFQRRTDTNAASTITDSARVAGVTAPHWVRLERDATGNFTALHSANGTTWESVGLSLPTNISMNANVYVGLALSSHNAAKLCKAIFSNVRTTGSVSAEWAHQVIGVPANATKSLTPHTVNSVTFSPDGSWILAACEDGTARLLNSTTGQPIGNPLHHYSGILAVAISPNGKRIATGDTNGSVRLWDATTLKPIGEPMQHEKRPHVAFSPDSSRLMTGSTERDARFWDADTGKSLGKAFPTATAFVPGDFWIDSARVYEGDYIPSDNSSPQSGDAATNMLANGGFETGVVEPWIAYGNINAEVVGALVGAAIPEAMIEGDSCLHVVVPEASTNYWDAGLSHTGHYLEAGKKYTLSVFLKSKVGKLNINVKPELAVAPWTGFGNEIITITEKWAEYNITTSVLPEDIGPVSVTFNYVPGGNRDVRATAHCPDGFRAVLQIGQGKYQMFDADRGEPIGPPVESAPRATAVAISPDGTRFATAKHHCLIQIWDATTGKLAFEPILHGGVIFDLAFSPDGSLVVSGGNTRMALLWDAATGEPIGAPLRQRNTVCSVAFSPDGKRVVTGNQDGVIRIWDIIHRKYVGEPVKHEDGIVAAAYGPDGLRILTETDGAVQVRDAATGKPIGKPLSDLDDINRMAFSPDGWHLAVKGKPAGHVELWDIATGQLVGESSQRVVTVAFSPDGSRILAGGGGGVAWLWDAATMKRLGEFRQQRGVVSSVAFTSDGSRFLTGSYDGITQLWDAATLEPIGRLPVHQSEVKGAAFSPDGDRILIGFADGTVRLWDAGTLKPIGTPLQHLKIVCEVAFSPDGSQLLACSIDRTARLWDAATLKPIGPPLEHNGWWPWASFSPDGSEILVGDPYGTTEVWQAPPGPLAGDYEQIACWVQVVTGMELDPSGGINVLDATTWQRRRQRLQGLGGPPRLALRGL